MTDGVRGFSPNDRITLTDIRTEHRYVYIRLFIIIDDRNIYRDVFLIMMLMWATF